MSAWFCALVFLTLIAGASACAAGAYALGYQLGRWDGYREAVEHLNQRKES